MKKIFLLLVVVGIIVASAIMINRDESMAKVDMDSMTEIDAGMITAMAMIVQIEELQPELSKDTLATLISGDAELTIEKIDQLIKSKEGVIRGLKLIRKQLKAEGINVITK